MRSKLFKDKRVFRVGCSHIGGSEWCVIIPMDCVWPHRVVVFRCDEWPSCRKRWLISSLPVARRRRRRLLIVQSILVPKALHSPTLVLYFSSFLFFYLGPRLVINGLGYEWRATGRISNSASGTVRAHPEMRSLWPSDTVTDIVVTGALKSLASCFPPQIHRRRRRRRSRRPPPE